MWSLSLSLSLSHTHTHTHTHAGVYTEWMAGQEGRAGSYKGQVQKTMCVCVQILLSIIQRWKKRWCILSNHLLRYYKSDTVCVCVCVCAHVCERERERVPTRLVVSGCYQFSLQHQVFFKSNCVCVLQDSNPAGTIFAEDIVDVVPDHDESKKDSKVA